MKVMIQDLTPDPRDQPSETGRRLRRGDDQRVAEGWPHSALGDQTDSGDHREGPRHPQARSAPRRRPQGRRKRSRSDPRLITEGSAMPRGRAMHYFYEGDVPEQDLAPDPTWSGQRRQTSDPARCVKARPDPISPRRDAAQPTETSVARLRNGYRLPDSPALRGHRVSGSARRLCIRSLVSQARSRSEYGFRPPGETTRALSAMVICRHLADRAKSPKRCRSRRAAGSSSCLLRRERAAARSQKSLLPCKRSRSLGSRDESR